MEISIDIRQEPAQPAVRFETERPILGKMESFRLFLLVLIQSRKTEVGQIG